MGIYKTATDKLTQAKQWSLRIAITKAASRISPLIATKVAALITAHKLGFLHVIEEGETIVAQSGGVWMPFHDLTLWVLAAVLGVPVAYLTVRNKIRFPKREQKRIDDLKAAAQQHEPKTPNVSDTIDHGVN